MPTHKINGISSEPKRKTGKDYVDGYKKIDVEEYRLVEKQGHNPAGASFDSFPSDGLWIVNSGRNSRSTTKLIDIKKLSELPAPYPIAELALRRDDICSAISKFIDGKNKDLLELGKCSYSKIEFAEFIVKYMISQELGGGSKKFLTEKMWIQVKGDEHERSRINW